MKYTYARAPARTQQQQIQILFYIQFLDLFLDLTFSLDLVCLDLLDLDLLFSFIQFQIYLFRFISFKFNVQFLGLDFYIQLCQFQIFQPLDLVLHFSLDLVFRFSLYLVQIQCLDQILVLDFSFRFRFSLLDFCLLGLFVLRLKTDLRI